MLLNKCKKQIYLSDFYSNTVSFILSLFIYLSFSEMIHFITYHGIVCKIVSFTLCLILKKFKIFMVITLYSGVNLINKHEIT